MVLLVGPGTRLAVEFIRADGIAIVVIIYAHTEHAAFQIEVIYGGVGGNILFLHGCKRLGGLFDVNFLAVADVEAMLGRSIAAAAQVVVRALGLVAHRGVADTRRFAVAKVEEIALGVRASVGAGHVVRSFKVGTSQG